MSVKNQSYSSSMSVNMEKEYVYHVYERLQRENSPVYGVESSDGVRISPLYFDELCYMLKAEGTHLVLFGGPWSEMTQKSIDRINYFAAKYGVDTVYSFDFRTDSKTKNTDIKVDLTNQQSYDGPGKREVLGCAEYNYIYGELITRHLTNLNDWVKGKIGSGDDITYLNLYQDAVTVPNLHEPFLFLFNKDNTADNSGAGHGEGVYPIIAAAELEDLFDENGEPAESFDDKLYELIFKYVEKTGVTPYTHADYMYEAFSMNERGHSFKTEDVFKKGEQINIQPVTMQELMWILDQKGSFVVLFAGAWCANSQAGAATVNDFAVANNVRVYMMDIRLDGKHPIDFWKYPRINELRASMPAMAKEYFRLWEQYLPGAPILCKINPNAKRKVSVTSTYIDEEGNEHTILPIDAPYLVACNKDTLDDRGNPAPVLAGCNHGGVELINCMKSFVYYYPNYRLYSAGVYSVFAAYCDSMGIEAKDKLVDRTAPLVEGEAVRHVETVAYHKEHDWYKERSNTKE